jgi:hypothetical protein
MDFREADRRYTEIKRQYEVGALTEEAFDEQIRKLMVQDRYGRWWAKARSTGKWHYHDGTTWVRRAPLGSRGWELVARTAIGFGGLFVALIGIVIVVTIIAVGLLTNSFLSYMDSTMNRPSSRNASNDNATNDTSGDTISKAYLEARAVFQDDFSDPSSGWRVDRKSNYGRYYENGRYRMYASPGTILGSHLGLTGEGQAYVVAVEAKLISDAADRANWGLVCHAQDSRAYYGAGVSKEGHAYILKTDRGPSIDVLDTSDVSAIFNEGTATNHLAFYCRGPDMVLYVNGIQTAAVHDETYPSGEVGLYVMSSDKPPAVDVLFDNFVVASP